MTKRDNCPNCGQPVGAHPGTIRARSPDGNTRCGACGKESPNRDWLLPTYEARAKLEQREDEENTPAPLLTARQLFKAKTSEQGIAYDRAHVAIVDIVDEMFQRVAHRMLDRDLAAWEAKRRANSMVAQVLADEVTADDTPTAGACTTSTDPCAIERDRRQEIVFRWAVGAFGADQATSLPQRGLRLLEEACEAYQAAGGAAELAHKLVDHVFSRPAGALAQELGGVGITLLAIAQAADLSANGEELREFGRILSKPPTHWNQRNAAKNAAGLVDPAIAAREAELAARAAAQGCIHCGARDGENHAHNCPVGGRR